MEAAFLVCTRSLLHLGTGIKEILLTTLLAAMCASGNFSGGKTSNFMYFTSFYGNTALV